MEWASMATNSQDAQFHQSRLLGMQDVARIFGIPLSVLGLLGRAPYASVAEEFRALYTQTISPWAKRIEASMERALLSRDARQRFSIEFDLAGLLRGDHKGRFESYQIAVTNGLMSPNG